MDFYTFKAIHAYFSKFFTYIFQNFSKRNWLRQNLKKMRKGLDIIKDIMVFWRNIFFQRNFFTVCGWQKNCLPNFRKNQVWYKKPQNYVIIMVPTNIRNSDYKLVKKYFCENSFALIWGDHSGPLYFDQFVSNLYRHTFVASHIS